MAQEKSSDSRPGNSLLISSVKLSVLAVLHIASWASCVVLGSTALWIRIQEDLQATFFGIAGVSIWCSLPFIVTGIICIATSKSQTIRSISWLVLWAAISTVFAFALLIYSTLAIASEAPLASSRHQKLIIAAITAFIAFLELITSVTSFLLGHHVIGWNCTFSSKVGPKMRAVNGNIRSARLDGIGDSEVGHVTVMALPPREAAELFLAMYRPFLGVNFQAGMQTAGGDFLPAEPQGVSYDNFPSERRQHYPHTEERRRRRKHHKRQQGIRQESPDAEIILNAGFIPEESGSNNEENDSAQEMQTHEKMSKNSSERRDGLPSKKKGTSSGDYGDIQTQEVAKHS
ncbi:uncharacterized protein LOC108950568 [Ciona intestinalis]